MITIIEHIVIYVTNSSYSSVLENCNMSKLAYKTSISSHKNVKINVQVGIIGSSSIEVTRRIFLEENYVIVMLASTHPAADENRSEILRKTIQTMIEETKHAVWPKISPHLIIFPNHKIPIKVGTVSLKRKTVSGLF